MKIGFDLTSNQHMYEGITRYSIEVVKRLISDYHDNDYTGYALAPFFNKKKLIPFYKTIYPQLDMRISNSYIPLRYIRFAYLKPSFLSCGNSILKNDTDIMVYFYNSIMHCKTKAKKVVVIHDIIPLYNTNSSVHKYLRYLRRYKKAVENSDLIFTVSEYSKNEIIKYFPEAKDKILITNNGVDILPYKRAIGNQEYSAVKEKYSLNKKYILFIGQPRVSKNLPNLINAYNILPEQVKSQYDLVLANSNTELNTLINKLKLNENVKCLNGFDEEDKAALLKMSSALCLVSTMEGFGIPIIEAMAAGTPVVTSNVSCMPEVAGDAARLVNPYNISSIAEGIEGVLTDENLRTELIEKGYKRAEYFSWENSARAFYNGLMSLQK